MGASIQLWKNGRRSDGSFRVNTHTQAKAHCKKRGRGRVVCSSIVLVIDAKATNTSSTDKDFFKIEAHCCGTLVDAR